MIIANQPFGAWNTIFPNLHEAIAEGRGHRYWDFTTYTTLTNVSDGVDAPRRHRNVLR